MIRIYIIRNTHILIFRKIITTRLEKFFLKLYYTIYFTHYTILYLYFLLFIFTCANHKIFATKYEFVRYW